MNRICIVGAGAVGGNIAVRLGNAGGEVTVIARGANAEAIRERGLVLRMPDGTLTAAAYGIVETITDRLAHSGAYLVAR